MATLNSASDPRGEPSSAGARSNTTSLPSVTSPAAQMLLPLVTAVAQSTASNVERSLDRHFTAMLEQQQQMVAAVQQLARQQTVATTNPPAGQLK